MCEERCSFLTLNAADSSRPNFKAFSAVIKEEKDRTKHNLETLVPVSLMKPNL